MSIEKLKDEISLLMEKESNRISAHDFTDSEIENNTISLNYGLSSGNSNNLMILEANPYLIQGELDDVLEVISHALSSAKSVFILRGIISTETNKYKVSIHHD